MWQTDFSLVCDGVGVALKGFAGREWIDYFV